MVTAEGSGREVGVGVFGVVPVYAVIHIVRAAVSGGMIGRDENGVVAERLVKVTMYGLDVRQLETIGRGGVEVHHINTCGHLCGDGDRRVAPNDVGEWATRTSGAKE